MPSADRLLVVSHRAPVEMARARDGTHARTVSGIATALDDAMRARNGAWIGWAPAFGDATLEPAATGLAYPIRAVRLKEPDVRSVNAGFANRVLWPLCHMAPAHCRFEPGLWGAYRQANERFATVVQGEIHDRALVWVNDFHLALVPGLLRAAGAPARLGVFWHIPFPPPELFGICPWRTDLLGGLLGADLIGFQTEQDARNFLDAVVQFLDLRVAGDPPRVCLPARDVRVLTLPVGIDAAHFAAQAAEPAVREHARQLRERLGTPVVVLGVDRLEHTKGILERLLGFERFLERHRDWRRRLALVQITVPPQFHVTDYGEMKRAVEETVGRIMGRFSQGGPPPLAYVYTAFNHEQLAAYYVAADVALVTPLRDGMNLVAKEYVACHPEGDGALILSEFAGAAHELVEALLVNPYDIDAIRKQLHAAVTMSPDERRRRMQTLAQRVAARDLRWWTASFLGALDA